MLPYGEIASDAINAMLPYLTLAAAEVAKGGAAEVGKDIYNWVKKFFGGNKDAEMALKEFKQKQNDKTQKLLLEQLIQVLESKPKEAQQLKTKVNNYNFNQKVVIKSMGETKTQIIQQQIIQGIDPERHADVLLALKEARIELERKTSENAELVEVQQLSETEIGRLKNELEKERGKGDFDKTLIEKLSALDANAEYAEADKLLEELDRKQNRENAKTKFQRAGYAKLRLKYEQALKYYEEAIRLDPKNALYLNDAGLMMNTLGFYSQATALFEQSVMLLNGDSPVKQYGNLTAVYNNLGIECAELGEYEKAFEFYTKALAMDRIMFGDEHPNVAFSYNNLGDVCGKLNDYPKAIDFFNHALAILTAAYGNEHSSVAIVYNNLGAAWDALDKYRKAIYFYNKALAIDIAIYGDKHPEVAVEYNNLGVVWDKLGEYKKSMEFYNKSLCINIAAYGDKHPFVAITYGSLGTAWYRLNDISRAIENVEKALHILENMYPDDRYPKIELCRETLAFLREQQQGK